MTRFDSAPREFRIDNVCAISVASASYLLLSHHPDRQPFDFALGTTSSSHKSWTDKRTKMMSWSGIVRSVQLEMRSRMETTVDIRISN